MKCKRCKKTLGKKKEKLLGWCDVCLNDMVDVVFDDENMNRVMGIRE